MDHRRWRCRWIWAPTELRVAGSVFGIPVHGTGEQHAFLRRRFRLDAVPERADARIVADSRYVLWVNGREVSRGPVRGDPSKLCYDPIDLAPHLRAGENAIAIHARYYDQPTPWWIPARLGGLGRRGAVAFELELPGAGGSLGSDGRWRAWLADAYRALPREGIGPVPRDDVDAAKLPAGWQRPDFDDAHWPVADELAPLQVGGDRRETSPPSNPYGALRPRPIPQLEGATRRPRLVSARLVERIAPAEPAADPPHAALADEQRATLAALDVGPELPVTLDGDGTIVALFDFGEIVSGLVGIEVEAPAGVEIELAIRETADRVVEGGMASDSPATFRYRTRGRDDVYESFDPMGLRYALLAIRGAHGPVGLRDLRVRERLYPERPGPDFECSDAALERVFAVGRRSVAVNAHDAYLDCPSREQRGWTGDAVVHQMVHLATNADWGLARWHPQMSNSPRPDGMLPMAAGSDLEPSAVTIPEWPLHWIRSLWNLWRYTGDREAVRGLMAGAENVLRWFLPYRGDHGLIRHVDQWVLIDWAALHLSDTSSCLNAQWARALLEFAQMADWLGDRGRADWARDLHAGVRDAFELFWDEARGGYVDHAVDGEPQRPMSQHAGATAVWAELVPADRRDRVLDAITDRARLVRRTWMERSGPGYLVLGPPAADWDVEHEIVAAQPFYRYVVHDAMAAAGRADEIPALCRDWVELLERGETTWPELWNGGTHCHGWGSTPTRDLVVYTLGIQPAEPGFATARVAPRLGDLSWARGAAPTPHGWVRVHASREKIEIESPVPVALDRGDGAVERLAAGHHIV